LIISVPVARFYIFDEIPKRHTLADLTHFEPLRVQIRYGFFR